MTFLESADDGVDPDLSDDGAGVLLLLMEARWLLVFGIFERRNSLRDTCACR
jgi:hypothetical protein